MNVMQLQSFQSVTSTLHIAYFIISLFYKKFN